MSLAVGPRTNTDPDQAVTQFESATWKRNLRTGPEVSFTMPANSPAALVTDGLTTDVWVYRNGVLDGRCRVLPVDQTWGEDGQDDVTITAVGYQRLVEARHIVTGPPTFAAVDQGAIGWALITATQATTGGSLGITAGVYTTGQVRDRTEYLIGDPLGTLMTALGDVQNGMWWGISPTLVYTAKLWTAFPTKEEPIARGMNARILQRQRGKTFANAAGVKGDATLTTPVWVTTAGIAADPRGRFEVFDSSHSSVVVQGQLAEYGNGLLLDRDSPPSVWTAQIDPVDYFEGGSNYDVGDYVNIVVPISAVDEIGPPAINVLAQVTEVTVVFDKDGATGVALAAVEFA